VLFVEHDIDRVFQIADHVTVMNEGKVWSTARSRTRAATPRCARSISAPAPPRSPPSRGLSAAGPTPLLVVDKIDTFYGKSHILNAVSLDVREHEILALLGRNGAGKSTLLKT
jgi:ABC-type sugar transport system ATPase subunit